MDDTGLSLTISVAGVKAAADEFVRSIESIKAAAASMNDSLSKAQAGVQKANDDSVKSTERLQKQYDSLRGSLDPATKALLQYQKAIETADRAMTGGIIKSQDEYNKILEQAKGRYDETIDSIGKMNTAHGALRGSSTSVREGFVLVHEFLSGNYRRAIGSATIEIQSLVGAHQLLAFITNPLTISMALLIGTMTALAIASSQTKESMKEVFNALALNGNMANSTAGQLETMAQNVSVSAGVTIKEARSMQAEFAATGKIGSEQFGSLILLTRRYADATGKDLAEAGKAMADAFSSFDGIKKLDQQYNFLTASQAKVIEGLKEFGDLSLASSIAQDAFGKRLDATNTKLSAFGEIMKSIKSTVGSWWDNIGKATPDATVDEKITQVRNKISGLDVGNTSLSPEQQASIKTQLDYFQKTLFSLQAQKEAQDKIAADKSYQSQIEAATKANDGLIESLDKQTAKNKELAKFTGDARKIRDAEYDAEVKSRAAITQNVDAATKEALVQKAVAAAHEEAVSKLALQVGKSKDYTDALEQQENALTKLEDRHKSAALIARDSYLPAMTALEKIIRDASDATKDASLTADGHATAQSNLKQATDDLARAKRDQTQAVADATDKAQKALDADQKTIADMIAATAAIKEGKNAFVEYEIGAKAAAESVLFLHKAIADLTAAGFGGGDPELIKARAAQMQKDWLAARNGEDAAKGSASYDQAMQAEKDKLEVLKKEIELSGQLPEIRKAEVEQLKASLELKTKFPGRTEEEIAAMVRLRTEQGKLQGQLQEQDASTKAMKKIWDGFYTGVSDSFFKMLDDVTTKGKDAFQTFADNISSVFKKLAMEIAAQLIFKPILQQIGGSLGINDLLGSISSGSGGGSLFGNSGTGGLDIIGGIKGIGSWLSGGFDSLFGSASAGAANAASAASGLPAGYSMGGQGVAGGFNSGGAAQAAASSGGGGSIFSGGGNFTTLSGANGLAAGLGAGFAGFSIGQMLTSLLGEKSQGSLVGGGIGGVAGFAVGGPVGAFIGSVLGSLLGGLFGPGKHHDAASVNIETAGQDANGNYTQFTAGNSMGNMTDAQAALLKDLGSVAAAENQMIQTLGGNVSIRSGLVGKTDQSGIPSPGFVGYNDQTKNWDLQWTGHDVSNIKEADLPGVIMREMTKWLVENNAVTGFSDTQKQIVNSTSFGKEVDPQKLANDIAFGDVYDNIIKIAQGSTDYGKAASATAQTLTALDKYFADATTQAKDLGLATDQFATAAQKAKESVGTAFVVSLQDQIDQLDGKGFLKTLHGFTTQAQGQFDDLKKLFDSGAFGDVTTDVAKASYESAKTLAATLQAKEASSVLVGLTASQISLVIDSFKDDTSVFGKAIEAAALAVQNGTAIVGAGVDAVTFKDKTQSPLDAAYRNAQSVLDPSLKAANDAINLAEQRRLSLSAALAVANLDDVQKLYIETTMRQTWALEDQAAVAGKAQTAMASATAAMKQFGTTINDYINKSSIDQFSGKSPTEILAATKQQFQDQLAAAQGGDSTALGGITSYAQNYRQAISTYYGGNAQGSQMSQGVLDQLAALLKTPGLTSNIANSTLRNQGDGSITVNDLGYVFLNGKVIPGVKTTNASLGTEISAFHGLAAQYSNGMSTDAYSKLAGQRDVVLAGYNDTQLQNVSNYAYGGQKVNSLDSFLQYLHGLDNNWLTANAGQDSTGGKTGPKQVASYEATIQTASAVSPTGAVPLGLSKIETAINDNLKPALIDSLNVRLHTDIGLLQTMMHTDIGALNATLSDTVGKAIATIPALVSSVTEMVGEVQGLQSQVISLTAQLTAVQIAAAKQAADDAAALLAATNRQTQTLTSPGGMAGSRAA